MCGIREMPMHQMRYSLSVIYHHTTYMSGKCTRANKALVNEFGICWPRTYLKNSRVRRVHRIMA